MISKEQISSLIKAAIDARKHAYAPYSQFKVGAAVLTRKNNIYSGINIENSSFGATICAERVAISKAVSENDREIIAISVVGSSYETFPCGICRQFMVEFAGKEFEIICSNEEGEYKIYKLQEILPYAFNEKSLKL